MIIVINFKELEKILKDDGWILKDIKGSHFQFIHSSKPGKITVPRHGKRDININTAKSILRCAKINFN